MIQSYSPNHEDIVLNRVFRDVADGFYVDIGAAWPDRESLTKNLYDRGWSGINVEPNPTLFTLLQAARTRDINVQAIVGSCTTNEVIHIVNDPSGAASGLSTTKRESASSWSERGYPVSTESVHATTLSALLSVHAATREIIHILKVDTEGSELDVLASNDWERWRPVVIVCEAIDPVSRADNPSDRLTEYLRGQDYKLRLHDGLNNFYEDAQNPLTADWSPANVLDEFIPFASDSTTKSLAHECGQLREFHAWATNRIADLETEVSWLNDKIPALQAERDAQEARLADLEQRLHEADERLQQSFHALSLRIPQIRRPR